jgi:hypothetical protein
MNKLEATILDQYRRVQAAGVNGAEVLAETQGEIMAVATPELTQDIIVDHARTSPDHENRSINAILRAQMDSRSVMNRSIKAIQNGHGLARINMLADNQGYSGGILFDYDSPIVYGNSMTFRSIKQEDPIQDAMGDTFYPPMMWVKAIRAEAYRNRAEAAEQLSIVEWLAELGLSLGCVALERGDITGATGFMPAERLQGEWDDPSITEHVLTEPIEAFRLSGLCDQAALDPNILTDTSWFASTVLISGGSLN